MEEAMLQLLELLFVMPENPHPGLSCEQAGFIDEETGICALCVEAFKC